MVTHQTVELQPNSIPRENMKHSGNLALSSLEYLHFEL